MIEEKQLPEKIYLFMGENRFSLQKEILRWKSDFQSKYGVDSVFAFNGENWDYSVIKQTIFGGGFFITNKLVIVSGIPSDTEKSNGLKSEQVEKICDDLMNITIPNETLVVCVSYKPDKRGRFYKYMEKINKEYSLKGMSKIKSFDLLSERELNLFVQREGGGLNLSNELCALLIHKIGNDQYRLVSEIEKLHNRKKNTGKEVNAAVIEDVCFGLVEDDTFKLLNLILNNHKEAVSFLLQLQEKGIDRNELNGMLVRGLRNYLFILDYSNHGIENIREIATEMKQNPWVVGNMIKILPEIKKNQDFLKALFSTMIEIDFGIKSGKLQPESYFLEIKKILLSE